MRYLFLIILVAFSTTITSSQPSIQYGITSGVNFSKYLSADLNYATGFHLGGSIELGLPTIYRNMYINSSLLFSQKGGKGDDLDNLKINAYYLELPIHIGIKQKLSDKFSLFEEIGPYFGFGLFGKTEYDSYYLPFLERKEIYKYDTFSKSGLKNWDLGIGFKVGTEYMKHIRLTCGIDFGTLNISRNSSSKNFNTYFGLSYYF